MAGQYYGSARGKLVGISATGVENMYGLFSYPRATGGATRVPGDPSRKGDTYKDPCEPKNSRWGAKQFGTQAPHRGMGGSLSQDCLFEKKFERFAQGEGWIGDASKVKLNTRAAYTNTCQSECYRETLRKELRVTSRNNSRLSAYAAKILAENQALRNRPMSAQERRARRRKRPTSASVIGERAKLELAAKLNPETYAPPLRNTTAAYMCENAHRPVIKKDSSPGFYRRTGGQAMMCWAT